MGNVLAYRPHFTASQAFDEAVFVVQNEFITDREVLRSFLPWSKKDFDYFLGENGVISSAVDYQIHKAAGYRKAFLRKKWALSGDLRQETQVYRLMATEDELRRLSNSYIKSLELPNYDTDDAQIIWEDGDGNSE